MPIALVEHYFRMYLWGCLKKRLTFESVNSKEDHSHQLGINKSTEGLNRTKWKGEFALSAWAERFILSCPKITTLMVLGCSESDQKLYHHSPNSQAFRSELNYTTGYLVLQSTDGKPWDFFFFFLIIYLFYFTTISIIMWVNFIAICTFISTSILLVLVLWRTLTNTMGKHTPPPFRRYYKWFVTIFIYYF